MQRQVCPATSCWPSCAAQRQGAARGAPQHCVQCVQARVRAGAWCTGCASTIPSFFSSLSLGSSHSPPSPGCKHHSPCKAQRLPTRPTMHLEAAVQWVTQVLGDLVHPDAAHRAHGQRTDQGVGVLRVLRGEPMHARVRECVCAYVRACARDEGNCVRACLHVCMHAYTLARRPYSMLRAHRVRARQLPPHARRTHAPSGSPFPP